MKPPWIATSALGIYRVCPKEAVMRIRPKVCCMLVAMAAGSIAFASPASKGDPVGTLRFADAQDQVIALDQPGIVYLVDFWALGCKPCIQEMPDLERLAREYEPSGKFRLVSVVSGGFKGQDLVKVAQQAGAKMTIYGDPENWHDRLEVDAFPTKFFVRDGTVLTRKRGGGAGLYDHWKGEVEKALKPEAASKAP
jgi:thiol-disulfide isomerase/thioredoxin